MHILQPTAYSHSVVSINIRYIPVQKHDPATLAPTPTTTTAHHLLPEPLRKPPQHGLRILRRPRWQRLSQLDIRIPTAHNATLLGTLRRRHRRWRSIRRHLHLLAGLLVRVHLGGAGGRRRKVLGRCVGAVVHGGRLGPRAVLALLVGSGAGALLVRVLRGVEGKVVLGGLAVAFALVPAYEELQNCMLERWRW